MTRLTALATLVFAAAALAAVPAFGGKPGGSSPSPASVSASPDPASSGTTVWVQGCGYNPSYTAELRISHSAGYSEAYAVAVWYTGCLNPTPLTAREAGTYTIEVYQRPPKPRNASLQLKASTVLTVTG